MHFLEIFSPEIGRISSIGNMAACLSFHQHYVLRHFCFVNACHVRNQQTQESMLRIFYNSVKWILSGRYITYGACIKSEHLPCGLPCGTVSQHEECIFIEHVSYSYPSPYLVNRALIINHFLVCEIIIRSTFFQTGLKVTILRSKIQCI